MIVKGYTPDDVRSGLIPKELAHLESVFPTLAKTPRHHGKKAPAAGTRSTSTLDCSNSSDFYDYGDFSGCVDDGGDDGGDAGGGSAGGGDVGGGGGGGDSVATKPFCPPFCPSQSWYYQQHGAVQMSSGGPLPDGSTWTSTDVDQSGGVVHGYIYHGSNGSQWYTGANDGSRPETMDQFQRNMDALYAQYQRDNNCV